MRKKRKWHLTAYDGLGIELPWDARFKIAPACEQALIHAFLAVAPALRGKSCSPVTRVTGSLTCMSADHCYDMRDEDWDQVFEPSGRRPPTLQAVDKRTAALSAARSTFRAWFERFTPCRAFTCGALSLLTLCSCSLCVRTRRYPMHALIAPATGPGKHAVLVSLYVHAAVWGPAMCPQVRHLPLLLPIPICCPQLTAWGATPPRTCTRSERYRFGSVW
jgi:hypothetical protein